jgi:hypothetical protein
MGLSLIRQELEESLHESDEAEQKAIQSLELPLETVKKEKTQLWLTLTDEILVCTQSSIGVLNDL